MRALATKSRGTPAIGQAAFKRTPDVRRILRGPQLQTELKIGAVDDPAERPHTCRSTIIILSSAMASEGLRLFGQALAQFMMVWQR